VSTSVNSGCVAEPTRTTLCSVVFTAVLVDVVSFTSSMYHVTVLSSFQCPHITMFTCCKHQSVRPDPSQAIAKLSCTIWRSSRLRLIQQVSVCIDEVLAWLKANRLQLNPTKTEVLWCASSRRQHQIPTGLVRVGDALVSPVTAARDLGVYIDAGVTMRTQVINTVRACFAALRKIRSVRRSLPQQDRCCSSCR